MSGADRQGVDANTRLTQLVFGIMAGHAVGAAVRLGLPDLLGDRTRSGAELAAECGTDPAALTRLLRALAAHDLLAEGPRGEFRLTEAGTLLRADVPGSVRARVQMFTDPAMVRAWERLDTSVTTGEPAFDAEFGTDFFDHLKGLPELSATFNAAMSSGTRAAAAALPGSFDFSPFDTLVDVGGGDGTLLCAVLAGNPGLNGVVFDSAEGAAEAPPRFRDAGVEGRATASAGDFFAAVPEGGDLYLLKSILHDWNDDRAAAILGNIRRVIPDHGRLLVVEPVLPDVVDGSARPTLYLSDLNMLVNLGGMERTREDFAALLRRSGFALDSVTATTPDTGFRLLVGVPS
ncbi:methyltransferase family protein [Murinocardiopsis flavida]|uniref:Methyltransferase family protein n=1 Tax=Murinocardiopsis flavida TaxID=645275 RepID=A0A2P8DUG6_9ACTN|nr:methyltransferase [Murinocardiopsis flavida]PSL00867.1 methyltransferase family protein [Murinocardiopsis flavida]